MFRLPHILLTALSICCLASFAQAQDPQELVPIPAIYAAAPPSTAAERFPDVLPPMFTPQAPVPSPRAGAWIWEADGTAFAEISYDNVGMVTRAIVYLGDLQPGDLLFADASFSAYWTDPEMYGRSCYWPELTLIKLDDHIFDELPGSARDYCEEADVIMTGAIRIREPGQYAVTITVGDTAGGMSLYGSANLRAVVYPFVLPPRPPEGWERN